MKFAKVSYKIRKQIENRQVPLYNYVSTMKAPSRSVVCFNLSNSVRPDEGDIVSEYRFHIQTSWRFFTNGVYLETFTPSIALAMLTKKFYCHKCGERVEKL